MQSQDRFVNYHKIVFWGKEQIIQVNDDSIAWGQQVLQSLHLGSLSDVEKVQSICTYLGDNFAFSFQRNSNIAEVIKKKGGNCVSHTLLGIFLLRLAGIPAKFAHEVHIIKQFQLISLYVGFWAKQANDGINSFWHNDHVWVWFRNTDIWEPFDSALDVCGLEHFYQKRFYRQKELSKGLAQKWTGPPFVIWEDVGMGFLGMQNITSTIINPKSMVALKHKDNWLEFVDQFIDMKQDDFHREYLPKQLMQKVKRMSTQWFKK